MCDVIGVVGVAVGVAVVGVPGLLLSRNLVRRGVLSFLLSVANGEPAFRFSIFCVCVC